MGKEGMRQRADARLGKGSARRIWRRGGGSGVAGVGRGGGLWFATRAERCSRGALGQAGVSVGGKRSQVRDRLPQRIGGGAVAASDRPDAAGGCSAYWRARGAVVHNLAAPCTLLCAALQPAAEHFPLRGLTSHSNLNCHGMLRAGRCSGQRCGR